MDLSSYDEINVRSGIGFWVLLVYGGHSAWWILPRILTIIAAYHWLIPRAWHAITFHC